MARKKELTWFAPAKCYKKYHKGTVYYFGKRQCKGKSDANGYRIAHGEWVALQASFQGMVVANANDNGVGNGVANVNGSANGHANGNGVANGSATIVGLLSEYLSEKRTDVRLGEICVKMFGEHRQNLASFLTYAGECRVAKINDIDS